MWAGRHSGCSLSFFSSPNDGCGLLSLFFCRCKTCGEYIYKGKKFNARKETVQNEVYLGLPIFRFYIKCTRCLAEITFKVKCAGGSSKRWEHGVCPYPMGKG